MGKWSVNSVNWSVLVSRNQSQLCKSYSSNGSSSIKNNPSSVCIAPCFFSPVTRSMDSAPLPLIDLFTVADKCIHVQIKLDRITLKWIQWSYDMRFTVIVQLTVATPLRPLPLHPIHIYICRRQPLLGREPNARRGMKCELKYRQRHRTVAPCTRHYYWCFPLCWLSCSLVIFRNDMWTRRSRGRGTAVMLCSVFGLLLLFFASEYTSGLWIMTRRDMPRVVTAEDTFLNVSFLTGRETTDNSFEREWKLFREEHQEEHYYLHYCYLRVESRNVTDVPGVPEPYPPTQQPMAFCPFLRTAFLAVFDPG